LSVALFGVKGWEIRAGGPGTWDPEKTIDGDVAIIPEVVIQDENTPADQALKPLFDLAWNAGGWSQSPFYDPVTGKREEPK
jgi:hypothetical protein